MTDAGRRHAAVMIVLCMGCLPLPSVAEANEAGAAVAGRDEAVVTTARAEKTRVEARVPVTGSLVARDPVQIHANVQGYEIREIRAEIGDSVKAGDVLLVLDEESLAAQLAQAEAEYERAGASVGQAKSQITSADAVLKQAAAALDRTRSLRTSGSASQAVLDDAIATEVSARAALASATDGLAVAQAQMAQSDAARLLAKLNLRHARVQAPVAGIIASRSAEIGALSGGGSEPLFTLIARGEIEFAAEVIETALAQITPGDEVEIDLTGGATIKGSLRLVPAAIDPVTRLGQTRIALEPDPRLRVGQFASGWIITDRREAVTVPLTAILADDQGERVQVVKEGVVETRPVRAGLIWQGQREILEGLQPGEEVIARAGAFFRSGDRVRVVPGAGVAE